MSGRHDVGWRQANEDGSVRTPFNSDRLTGWDMLFMIAVAVLCTWVMTEDFNEQQREVVCQPR